jgi:hypothetical protein
MRSVWEAEMRNEAGEVKPKALTTVVGEERELRPPARPVRPRRPARPGRIAGVR